MKITYDRNVDALCIRLLDTTVITHHVAQGLAVDYDARGYLAGVEVLDAAKKLGPDALRQVTLENISVARP